MLLLVNLVVVLGNDAIGLSTGTAVRISLLSAALWWAGFTIIPFVGLRNRAPVHTPDSEGRNWSSGARAAVHHAPASSGTTR